MSKNFNLAVIAGDGIGPEVVNEGLKILDAAGKKHGFSQAHANALVMYSRGSKSSKRFDDLGILKKINFLDKKALSKNPFDEANTISLGKDSSFLSSFLASMRQRAKNFGKTND